ncbi:TMEM165/GDT1 family protein [Pantanalinema rosaneae CENA516]|uniref:TMEM165/GDT1 family protein n=1 Tax=Pantanalinema rosaneae TaxID=1620701 RepID=UPI003D6E772B
MNPYSSAPSQPPLYLERTPIVPLSHHGDRGGEPVVAKSFLVEEKELVPPIADPTPISPASQPTRSIWTIFTSTFITIFLAELGDKTQVSTLLMSAEFHQPWVVFAGAATALITTSLLGVLIGRWLATRLSPKTLDTAAGIILALLSVGLLWDVLRM